MPIKGSLIYNKATLSPQQPSDQSQTALSSGGHQVSEVWLPGKARRGPRLDANLLAAEQPAEAEHPASILPHPSSMFRNRLRESLGLLTNPKQIPQGCEEARQGHQSAEEGCYGVWSTHDHSQLGHNPSCPKFELF